jgi:dTDP-4-dehydrorhamnose 3,5-epimerase
MKISLTPLKGAVVIEPDVHRDARGFFLETFHSKKYAEAGLVLSFVQDNHSRSVKGTLRGLHGQLNRPQGKLVRVTEGEVFDVAVDARPQSDSFGQWVGVVLSAENFKQFYVPPGFLHGFYVLSPFAEVEYKCTDYYDAKDEIGALWNDPRLGIDWPNKEPILSEKDKKLPPFEQMTAKLEKYRENAG